LARTDKVALLLGMIFWPLVIAGAPLDLGKAYGVLRAKEMASAS
jgi:hypothetical protein